jgi:hypothetical protein
VSSECHIGELFFRSPDFDWSGILYVQDAMCVPMYGDRFQHLFCLLTQNRCGKYSEQGNLFVANDCPVLLFTAFYKQSLVNL